MSHLPLPSELPSMDLPGSTAATTFCPSPMAMPGMNLVVHLNLPAASQSAPVMHPDPKPKAVPWKRSKDKLGPAKSKKMPKDELVPAKSKKMLKDELVPAKSKKMPKDESKLKKMPKDELVPAKSKKIPKHEKESGNTSKRSKASKPSMKRPAAASRV